MPRSIMPPQTLPKVASASELTPKASDAATAAFVSSTGNAIDMLIGGGCHEVRAPE